MYVCFHWRYSEVHHILWRYFKIFMGKRQKPFQVLSSNQRHPNCHQPVALTSNAWFLSGQWKPGCLTGLQWDSVWITSVNILCKQVRKWESCHSPQDSRVGSIVPDQSRRACVYHFPDPVHFSYPISETLLDVSQVLPFKPHQVNLLLRKTISWLAAHPT